MSSQFAPGPPAIVYKTKADYSDYVPVTLSDDKSKIVSYPDPKDIRSAAPVKLKEGYLLDNRGISKNVAFLRWTYEEYKKLPIPLPQDIIYGNILDKDPLTEMCDCGNKSAFKDIESQLNEMIEKGKLRTICKTVK